MNHQPHHFADYRRGPEFGQRRSRPDPVRNRLGIVGTSGLIRMIGNIGRYGRTKGRHWVQVCRCDAVWPRMTLAGETLSHLHPSSSDVGLGRKGLDRDTSVIAGSL